VIVAITLTDALYNLGTFGITISIMFILIWNMFWTFIFLKQFGAWHSTL
jgi:hypothetical protein